MSGETQGTSADSIVSFGAFELDMLAEELRRRGVRLHLQDMPLKVLAMLVEQPGELIRREVFFERLWPDDATGILDDNLNSAIRKLRIALDDSARSPRFIETEPRRGYRFVAPIKRVNRTAIDEQSVTSGHPSSRPTSTRPGVRELASLFVGRDGEMADLRATLDDCLNRRQDWLVMLSGEAGIGKTRVAESLADEATERGMAVKWGRSLEESGGPPYWPWVQILRALVRSSDDSTLVEEMGAGAADIAGIVPELTTRLGIKSSEPLATAEQDRFRLFDSIAGYLSRTAERQPLMLVFDNLHWAGRPSLLLLQFMVPALADSPVFILGTYRSSDVSRQHPLFETLGALNRESRFLRMQLKGLGPQAVEDLLQLVMSQKPPAGLVNAIHRETEGNSFFVSEVIRLLISEHTFCSDQSTASMEHGQPLVIDIPEGIREVIGKRLNHLSATCNRVLGDAAVVGRQFGLPVLLRLVDEIGETELVQALEEAMEAGVIVDNAQSFDAYRFSHALIRETLYDELSAARRSRLHARVGTALEQLQADGSQQPRLSQLAHHFTEAARSGDMARAVDYNIRAAEQAESQLAYEEAAAFYQAALDTLELDAADDEIRRCRLLLSNARAGNPGAGPARGRDRPPPRLPAGPGRCLQNSGLWRGNTGLWW